VADPNDEKAPQQVGPDAPSRDSEPPAAGSTASEPEEREDPRPDERPVEPSDEHGLTTEYGTDGPG
jgi:hypothetical protein